jgi:hypothetical protein
MATTLRLLSITEITEMHNQAVSRTYGARAERKKKRDRVAQLVPRRHSFSWAISKNAIIISFSL